jgi:hypothetical protein
VIEGCLVVRNVFIAWQSHHHPQIRVLVLAGFVYGTRLLMGHLTGRDNSLAMMLGELGVPHLQMRSLGVRVKGPISTLCTEIRLCSLAMTASLVNQEAL